MEARAAPGRSSGGDRYGRERCRALDIAARIVFGVSVMDRQIEEYLVAMSVRELGTGELVERGEIMTKIRRMGFGARKDKVIRHVAGNGAKTLFEEIRKVRSVRHVIAHSTADVDAEGAVMIRGEAGEPDMENPREFRVDMLSETLKKADWCNRRLKEVLGHPPKIVDALGEAP